MCRPGGKAIKGNRPRSMANLAQQIRQRQNAFGQMIDSLPTGTALKGEESFEDARRRMQRTSYNRFHIQYSQLKDREGDVSDKINALGGGTGDPLQSTLAERKAVRKATWGMRDSRHLIGLPNLPVIFQVGSAQAHGRRLGELKRDYEEAFHGYDNDPLGSYTRIKRELEEEQL